MPIRAVGRITGRRCSFLSERDCNDVFHQWHVRFAHESSPAFGPHRFHSRAAALISTPKDISQGVEIMPSPVCAPRASLCRLPELGFAQTSPFLTGAEALQENLFA